MPNCLIFIIDGDEFLSDSLNQLKNTPYKFTITLNNNHLLFPLIIIKWNIENLFNSSFIHFLNF